MMMMIVLVIDVAVVTATLDGSSCGDDGNDVGDNAAGEDVAQYKQKQHTNKHNMMLCESMTQTALQRSKQATRIHVQIMVVIMLAVIRASVARSWQASC